MAHLAVYNDGVQPIFGPKMLVNDRLRDSRSRSDLLDGGPRHAIIREKSAGHTDELFTTLTTGHPRMALGG